MSMDPTHDSPIEAFLADNQLFDFTLASPSYSPFPDMDFPMPVTEAHLNVGHSDDDATTQPLAPASPAPEMPDSFEEAMTLPPAEFVEVTQEVPSIREQAVTATHGPFIYDRVLLNHRTRNTRSWMVETSSMTQISSCLATIPVYKIRLPYCAYGKYCHVSPADRQAFHWFDQELSNVPHLSDHHRAAFDRLEVDIMFLLEYGTNVPTSAQSSIRPMGHSLAEYSHVLPYQGKVPKTLDDFLLPFRFRASAHEQEVTTQVQIALERWNRFALGFNSMSALEFARLFDEIMLTYLTLESLKFRSIKFSDPSNHQTLTSCITYHIKAFFWGVWLCQLWDILTKRMPRTNVLQEE